MREVLRQLVERTARGEPFVYCRLVETRGSTPQKAGAAMLVYGDGSQTGTLGGGCVEAEVKRRALGTLAEGQSQVLTFNLDSDYGWDDGLICGGRMQILVDPLRDESSQEYFQEMARLIEQGAGCTEAIVFDEEKSGLNAPASYLFDAGDELVALCPAGRNGASERPQAVRAGLRPLSERPRPHTARGIAYLPVLPRCRLLIVGGGHVGQAVGNLAAELDFAVWVVDDRAEYVSRERFPKAERLIADKIDALAEIEVTPDTYCLIVTRGHNHDEVALYHLAARGARYVGLIGSKRKIKMIFEDLEQEGISRDALARVFAPVGIDIGSQTVTEIAVSILAELVSHRNRGGVVPGRKPPILEVESV
jgi:xanthine dehydrogenase accessory factor